MKYLWMALSALFVPMFLSAQDADYMKLRSSILPEERDNVDAAEVEESEIDVGEMNKKLLQKEEELTLCIIQQDKEMREVKQRLLLPEHSFQTR